MLYHTISVLYAAAGASHETAAAAAAAKGIAAQTLKNGIHQGCY